MKINTPNPVHSILHVSGFGILLEVPAVGFVEQSADEVTLIITDVIDLLDLLDSIFKAYPVYFQHCRLDDLTGIVLSADNKRHSPLPPSSAAHWIACPPSALKNAEIEDKQTEAALEGTVAHSLCEYKVKNALGENVKDPTEDLDYYNAEMEECAEGYMQFVMEQICKAKESCNDSLITTVVSNGANVVMKLSSEVINLPNEVIYLNVPFLNY